MSGLFLRVNQLFSTVSVLGQDKGYTIKYTVYPESSPYTESISFQQSLG
jgi:hypothetical protein